MGEQPDNQNTRLEGMLRRWGADEAARQAKVGPMPRVLPPTTQAAAKPAGVSPWRWLPLAAAAGLLVGAGALFVAARPWSSPPAGQGEELARLRQANQQLQADADGARLARAEAERKLKDERAASRSVADDPEYKRLADAEAEARRRAVSLEEALGAKDKDLKAAETAMKGIQDKDKEYKAAQDKLRDVDRRLAAAVDEMARMRKMNDEADQARTKAQSEYSSLSGQREALLGDFQRAYLGPGGEESLRIRQEAARRNRLVQRCAELRKAEPSDQAGKLMDRLEVVLLRLDMLDASDAGAAMSFAGLVREGDLVGQIDRVLVSSGQSAKSRAWLLEVRCVLMGADRAT